MFPALIEPEDFENLPADPERKFLAIEAICRRKMVRLITGDTPPSFDAWVRGQYATVVATAAEELDISGFPPLPASVSIQELDEFAVQVTVMTTRLGLRGATARDPHSVCLAAGTRGKIEQQLEKLRQIIRGSELPESKRKSLVGKLDELSMELSQTRVSFAKAMAVMAFVSSAVVNGTVFLAEAPHAIATIASLLGSDKAAEELERERLGPPPTRKALPQTPARRALPPTKQAQTTLVLDDDIPF